MKICPICSAPVEIASDLIVDWHSECYSEEAWDAKVLPLIVTAIERQQADARETILKSAVAETFKDRDAIADPATFQKAVARNFNRMMGL